ncbi:cytochrome P460 family protein [Gimesia aquarii]|uniref:Cytochrome P460 domain-containing protein n=1 Tax=Gimesia aquarii TaxID=2527964 RepID=A0A517VU26_9PLAN|nr:cytochrome P460 family protein [Gimesia aquarii]QDT96505.1 hypothetical protein V144x_19620 [Gimesia aquarii]
MKNLKQSGLGLVLVGATTLSLTLLSGCGTAVEPTTTAHAANQSTAPMMKKGAEYNDQGALIRPKDHREWVFIGAPVTPNDMNNGKAAFPEFHNVYIDPMSFAEYKKTGTFPNGTVILKELVSVGSKAMPSGNGYFQGNFVSLEAMVKDTKRFEEEPGGWAFFRFGEAPHYNPTGARMKTESCNSCHSGAEEGYVFTDTYPVLRAAKAKVEAK